MKKTLSSLAAATVLVASTAISPVLAQQATSPATSTPAAPAEKMAPTTAAPATTMASGQDSYLTEQSATQISANDYIGKSIYNGKDEAIGDVNDLIFEENQGLVAAVVGVGGFLGIGEKNVALPMSKITVSRDANNNNNLRLTTPETAEALKAAPEFKTLEDQKSEADKTTTSSTTPAPAAGDATTPSTAPATK